MTSKIPVFECPSRLSEVCAETCFELWPEIERIELRQSAMVEEKRTQLNELASEIINRFNSFGGGLMSEGVVAIRKGFADAGDQWTELRTVTVCRGQKGIISKKCTATTAYSTLE